MKGLPDSFLRDAGRWHDENGKGAFGMRCFLPVFLFYYLAVDNTKAMKTGRIKNRFRIKGFCAFSGNSILKIDSRQF